MPGHLGRGQSRSQGRDYGAKAGPGSDNLYTRSQGVMAGFSFLVKDDALLERAFKMRNLG